MKKESSSFASLLLETAQPDLYRHNAFRALNLDVRASMTDIKRQLRRMELERNFGDGNAAPEKPVLSASSDAAMIVEAKSRLEDVERRFIDEFFVSWTRPGEQALTQASSVHDRAVMFHTLALDIELSANHLPPDAFTDGLKEQRDYHWREAVVEWRRVLEDEQVWRQLFLRVNEINDPRLTNETVYQLRETLPLALLLINARLAVQASQRNATAEALRHAGIMREFAFESELVTKARQYAVEPLCRRINDLCKTLQREAQSAPASADEAVELLLARTRPLLMAVDDLLPKGDSQRTGAFDTVASAVNDAIVTKSETLSRAATRDWEAMQQRFERIAPYAATQTTRNIITKNIAWAKDNVQLSVSACCWFCVKSEGSAGINVIVRLYQKHAENQYYYDDVFVPRCDSCKEVHDRQSKLHKACVAVVVIICAGFFALFRQEAGDFILSGNTISLGKVALLIFLIIIVFSALVALCESILAKTSWTKIPEGIKPIERKVDFPAIKEAQNKGWTTIQPTT